MRFLKCEQVGNTHILSVISNLPVFILSRYGGDIMSKNEKTTLTYTKAMFINNIAMETGQDPKTVRSIYNALEEDISRFLLLADEDTDVSLRLFEGITINSTFVPEKAKVNNLTGEEIIASSKIKPKANITRNYCEKLNRSK